MVAMRYGFSVQEIAGGTTVVSDGEGPDAGLGITPIDLTDGAVNFTRGALALTNVFKTQDEAASKCRSWIRQYQASDIDARGIVVGKPLGDEVANSLYTLVAGDRAEKTYEQIDSVGKGLRQRINGANRVNPAFGVAGSTDYAPDIHQPQGP